MQFRIFRHLTNVQLKVPNFTELSCAHVQTQNDGYIHSLIEVSQVLYLIIHRKSNFSGQLPFHPRQNRAVFKVQKLSGEMFMLLLVFYNAVK